MATIQNIPQVPQPNINTNNNLKTNINIILQIIVTIQGIHHQETSLNLLLLLHPLVNAKIEVTSRQQNQPKLQLLQVRWRRSSN
jgi:hypothetical protein